MNSRFNITAALSFVVLAIAAAGCATRPIFEDVPAVGPWHKRVTVDSIIDTDEAVRTTCTWKAREGGSIVHLFATGANGCTYREGDRIVILWTDPGSYSNGAAMEAAGHELYHRHNLKDHK